MKGKRKFFLVVIVIMLLISLVLLNSYAWWRISRGQTDDPNNDDNKVTHTVKCGLAMKRKELIFDPNYDTSSYIHQGN